MPVPDSDPMPSTRWCGRFLCVWLVVRTLAWLVAITASHPNGPLDLIEWLSWGHSLQWGYPKHPPLPAWLATGFARLSPGDVWGVYVLGYLSAAACLVAAYRLGLRYLPPPLALCAALSLEGLMYLTNDPAEWSNNVALAVGWAWTIVLGERAVRTNGIGSWLAVGAVIGLTLLCKYTLGVLLLPLAAYLVWTPTGRRCLRTPGPYLAVGVAAAVFAPHADWVVQHDFVTLKYAVERSQDANPLARLMNPLAFVGGQIALLVPVWAVLVPWFIRRNPSALGERGRGEGDSSHLPSLSGGRRAAAGGDSSSDSSESPLPVAAQPTSPQRGEVFQTASVDRDTGDASPPHSQSLSPGDRSFLHFAFLGPVVVLILLSVITGCQLREIWGSPLWTFYGVWLLAAARSLGFAGFRPGAFRWSLTLAGGIGAALMAFTVVKQVSYPYLSGKTHRPHFPGKQLAAEVSARWHARFPTAEPFPIAAGEGWTAGNVCVYSPHRPVLFSSGNMGALDFAPALSPWTSDADLATRGGVIVWDAKQLGDTLPPDVAKRFPTAFREPALELQYRTGADIPPARIGLALVPPGR